MLVPVPSAVPAGGGGDGLPEAGGGAGLAGLVAARPGLREDWLADLRREGLIGELLADGVIAAGHAADLRAGCRPPGHRAWGRPGPRRWKTAAVGGYHDGENALADELEGSLSEGMLNLADRGFFSMSRRIRFSRAWRVKNSAWSVPFKTVRTLTDGSELVLLRESSAMLGTRRHDAADKPRSCT